MLYLSPQNISAADESIARAAYILQHNGVVAFPTETVYGLGARFDSVTAIAKIFEAKGRPQDNPLIVHISELNQLNMVVQKVPALAEKLISAFWPGPLTIVLQKTPNVPSQATGGLATVGVRMPSNSIALALISAVGVPLVAPSANISGRPSPTSAIHVREDLAGRIDAILDGGEAQVGLESTVISVTENSIVILRPGAVTREMLEEAGRVKVLVPDYNLSSAPLSPGLKYTHYAPRARVTLFVGQAVAELPLQAQKLQEQGEKVAVVAYDDTLKNVSGDCVQLSLGERGQVVVAAKLIYAHLREADNLGSTQVLIEGSETEGLGEALMNRLRKAASQIRE